MDIAQVFLGFLINALAIALLAAGIMKIFQIAVDVREMKEFMRRSPTQVPSPSPAVAVTASSVPMAPMSPEDLVRAVHAQHYSDENFPASLDAPLTPRR